MSRNYIEPHIDVVFIVSLLSLCHGACQPGRRPRRVSPPVVPLEEEIEGVFTAWKFPDVYESGGGIALKGLYVLFHGCRHNPRDW